MGSGSTKLISYDDASKRFSSTDLERIETSFRDFTNGTGELSYTSFKRDVFANYLPEKLATPLYHVCTSSSRSSMSLKDLVCCLALIHHGTQKERMQLLYLIFSYNVSNSNGNLRWRDVKDFLSLCGDNTPEDFERIFQNDEIVTQEKFLTWLRVHHGQTTTIIDWLMDEQSFQRLNQTVTEKNSDLYSILAGVTHLSEIEIRGLENTYLEILTNSNRQQQITLQIFSNLLTPVLPPMLIPGFFDAFDENRDGCIDIKEYVCGISAACRGPQAERHKFLFRVFDRDHDGVLNRYDLVHMCSCLIDVAQFVNSFEIQKDDSPDIYADRIIGNRLNSLEQADFLQWCPSDRLIGELLNLIFQIFHVVLGLKPASKTDEISIVKNYLRREQYPFVEAQAGVSSKTYHWINCNRATSKPGSVWYLIAIDWWLRWEASSQTSTENVSNVVQKKNSSSKLNKINNVTDTKKDTEEIDNTWLIEKNSIVPNRSMYDECFQLKSGLHHRTHYEMVPELLWKFLKKTYGCNGTAIMRKVTYKRKTPKPELDLYPLLIKIYRSHNFTSQQLQTIAESSNQTQSSNNAASHAMHLVYPLLSFVSTGFSSSVPNLPARHNLARTYFVSPYQTVRSLAEELAVSFSRPLEEIRLWMKYNENDLRIIDFDTIDEILCQDAGFDEKTEIVLECRNKDLTWPEELYSLATSSKSSATSSTHQTTGTSQTDQRGLIGLSNLGNTCFLNSAVQCLSHCDPLTFYFREKYHFYEINKDNPIGMQGMIALRYGQLISKLWETTRGPLAPLELRGSVAKFASSRFTEFQQHDCQEFLSFLLDGLHEDLNRVHLKPYVELKDSDDRPDEDVAKEHWNNHLARNNSIIVDLFHGLLRSQVKCRTCDLNSVRFDPFNILSLPLPVDTTVIVKVKLIHLDGSRPTQYAVKLDGDESVQVLKEQLATLASLSSEQIGFFDLTNSLSLQPNLLMEKEQTKIKSFPNLDLLAYELPVYEKEQINTSDKDSLPSRTRNYLIAIHRRLQYQERYFTAITHRKILFFGQPILIPYQSNLTMKTSNRMIYMIVFKQLKRLLRKPKDNQSISNHAFDCDDSLGELYPFTLKYVHEDGKKCSICPWNRFCLGCVIESNDKDFSYSSGNIAIEWESSVYHLRYLSHCEEDVEIHSSVKLARSNYNDRDPLGTVRLEDCLQSFIQWENLDQKELFNCKRCRQMQPAKKKLDIWKLPPFLIFHIKRFQLWNNRWIKSSRPVLFPIDSLRPSEYLAQRSTPRSPNLPRPVDGPVSSSSSSSLSSFTGITSDVVSTSSIDNMFVLSPSRLVNGHASSLSNPLVEQSSNEPIKIKKKRFGSRKKKEKVANVEPNLLPPRFSHMEERTMSFGDNSFDVNDAAYNLYAFVCHYGVIGGGHYLAFIKHQPSDQWYCFNDSSVKPIPTHHLQEYTSSAYILFYQRENLDYRNYMPNVTGKKQVANDSALANEDRLCSVM